MTLLTRVPRDEGLRREAGARADVGGADGRAGEAFATAYDPCLSVTSAVYGWEP